MLELRPHQIYGIDGLRGLIAAGKHRPVLVAPTGSGKRFQAVWLARSALDKAKTALFVCNRRTLVAQLYNELGRFGVPYGVIMGNMPQNRDAPIQVASMATLRERHFDTGDGLPPADLLVVDECHNEPDAQRRLFQLYPNAAAIGLTATPVGSGGTTILGPGSWNGIFEGAKIRELIAAGYLLPVRTFAPSEPDIEGVTINGREYHQGQLKKRIRDVTSFADVFQCWERWRHLPTIVFAPGVEFARELAAEFGKLSGIKAAHVEAKTPLPQRDRLFAGLQDGGLNVLVSVGVLKEGFDCPAIGCGIDLQPTVQLRDYVQKVGRIRRAYGDLTEAIWLDMSGAYWRHGHPDEDFPWLDVKGKLSAQDIKQRNRDTGKEKQPIRCPQCHEVRQSGNVCPACGFEAKAASRAIRMGNGQIVEQQERAAIAKTEKSWEQKNWDAALWRGIYSGKTFAQIRYLYYSKTREWPPYGLKNMPAKAKDSDPAAWAQRPTDVYEWAAAAKAKADANKVGA